MTAAPAGPAGNDLFSMFSNAGNGHYRARGEAFLLSLLGQALVVVLLALLAIYCRNPLAGTGGGLPLNLTDRLPLPVIFSGPSGGGGGNHDLLPASHGALPPASVIQLAPPTAILPKEMPRLPVDATVELAPEIKILPGSQVGDPLSKVSSLVSNGPGGLGGIGTGCCDGVGPGHGPGAGPGPGGRYLAGIDGVTVPRAIYSPEPSFSDEARQAKAQGIVVLLLVVGADGHTHDIRVQRSLGMGLDEKAIEAVKTWRFIPATLKGKPIDAQIALEVDFHLY
jgi:periplasmic protein TonB